MAVKILSWMPVSPAHHDHLRVGQVKVKTRNALTLAAGAVILLAGCGGASHHAPAAQASRPPAPSNSAAQSPSASPSPSVSASANERLFADAMAQPVPDIPAGMVAGAQMLAYAQNEHAQGAAFGAIGQPAPSGSVTQITGGFNICYQASTGSGCTAFTQFTTNSAGQITGVLVNGQPVAGRVATAPSATSDGLTISKVTALRVVTSQNLVIVTFKLKDTSYKPVNTSPSLLASLNGASDDTNQDALPADLRPGDTLYAVAGFDVSRVGGQFCLVPNDGFGERLPCTTLRKV
jgi:hypothetical protein